MAAVRASMILPYAVGFVSGAVLRHMAKPVSRGALKAGIRVAMEIRRVAAEATEDLQDIAAEVYAETVPRETSVSGNGKVAMSP